MVTRARIWLSVFLVIGVGLRAALVAHATPPNVSDARDYLEFAKSLASGSGYKQHYRGESPHLSGLTLRAYRPPGFPAVRAVLLMLGAGESAAPVLWLNLLWELLAAIALLRIALKARRRSHAVWFAFLWALSATWTANPMTESLTMALWAWIAHEASLEQRTPLRSVVLGVLLMCATFVRPVSLVFLVLVPYFEFRRQRAGAIVRLVCAVAPAAICLLAWTARNYVVLGAPVLMSTNFGVHNAGDFHINKAIWRQLHDSGFGEAEINRAFIQMILTIVTNDPLYALRIIGRRLVDLFSASLPCFEIDLMQKHTLHGVFKAIHEATFRHAPVVYVLAVANAPQALARRRDELHVVAMLVVAFVTSHALVSRGDLRLMAPAYPLLAYLASHALAQLVPSGWRQARSVSSGLPQEPTPSLQERSAARARTITQH